MNSFKNRLDKYWSNQDVLFNYKSVIDSRAENPSRKRDEPDIEDQR